MKCLELYSDSFFDKLSLSCQFLRELSLEASKSLGSAEKIKILLKFKNLTCLKLKFSDEIFVAKLMQVALQKNPSLKVFEIHSPLCSMEIFTNWSYNAVIIHKENDGVSYRRDHAFRNKTECINFLSKLAESELILFYTMLRNRT